MQNRVFFPQAAFDQWLVDGFIELSGSELTIIAQANPALGRKYRIAEGVRVLREVAGQADQNDLIGKVKSRNFLEELGAEILEDSMIIGDNAYEVVQGWLGAPAVPWEEHAQFLSASDFTDEPKTDEDLLAKYLLRNL